MSVLAYHYTYGIKYQQIIESGVLQTTPFYIGQKEKQVLWFSKNHRWDTTANMFYETNGRIVTLSMHDTKEFGGGLVRFGYPHDLLFPWNELCIEVGIKPSRKLKMEESGYRMLSNPDCWMGCLHSIPVSDLVVEIMNDQYKWELIQL